MILLLLRQCHCGHIIDYELLLRQCHCGHIIDYELLLRHCHCGHIIDYELLLRQCHCGHIIDYELLLRHCHCGHFPLPDQLDLNVVKGWQQIGHIHCPFWLTKLGVICLHDTVIHLVYVIMMKFTEVCTVLKTVLSFIGTVCIS